MRQSVRVLFLLVAGCSLYLLARDGGQSGSRMTADPAPGAAAESESPALTGQGERRLSQAEADGSPPGSPGSAAPSRRHLQQVRVRGCALDEEGEPVQSVIRASGVGGFARFSVVCRTDERGQFECDLELPGDALDVLVVACPPEDDATTISYPSRHRLEPGEERQTLEVMLVARSGARVVGRVPEAEADASGHLQALLSELPVDSDEQFWGWNSAGFAVHDRWITPKPAGSFSEAIRPGRFVVRSVAADGRLGPAYTGVALPGHVIDVGALAPPGPQVRFHVEVVDETGARLDSAWLQLADRSVSVAACGGRDAEFPHFVSGADGTVELGVAVADLPMGPR